MLTRREKILGEGVREEKVEEKRDENDKGS